MISFRKTTYFLLTSMLFWPLMSYITMAVLELRTIVFYYTLFITMFYGIVFIFFKKNIKVPKCLFYLLLFIIYLFFWSFFNGDIKLRGIIPVIFDNPQLAVFFIVLIIYNTRFSYHFIIRNIFILKITIIIAAIVSTIQVFNSEFLGLLPIMKNLDTHSVNLYNTRRLSIFGHIDHNSIGLSFMPILAIVIGFLLYNNKKIYVLFFILGGLTAFLSNIRYVIISFILITLQVLFFRKITFKGAFKYTGVVFILIISLYIIMNIYFEYDFTEWGETRLLSEGSLKETTRYKAISTFSFFFPKYYLFGNGEIYDEKVVIASQRVGSSHIHVGYLSHLVAYGIIGCFLLFSFWFYLLKRLYKTAIQTNYWGAFFAFLIFLWAFLSNSISIIFYYGLIFALVIDKYFRDNYISNNNFNTISNNLKL